MRLSEAKNFDRRLNRRFRLRAETRDAIVWDIDTNNYLARCKIQGSNEYVLCHYPRNWQTLPVFLKRGNAVRIQGEQVLFKTPDLNLHRNIRNIGNIFFILPAGVENNSQQQKGK